MSTTEYKKEITDRDAFAHSIVARIDPEIRVQFTEEQLTAVITAISSRAPKKKHSLDIRFVIPFFFIKLYFVVLAGRDRRGSTAAAEKENRKSADIVSGIFFTLLVLIPLLLVSMIVLYYIKRQVGIDIFPGVHFWDIIGEVLDFK